MRFTRRCVMCLMRISEFILLISLRTLDPLNLNHCNLGLRSEDTHSRHVVHFGKSVGAAT